MPSITGTVKCLRVSETFGFTTIDPPGPAASETFILWFGTSIPDNLTAFTRIVHSMWISILREAHANDLTVTITHPTGLAEVTDVQLGEFP